MDGSNLCLTRDAVYARSHSGAPTHKSFDMAKALHAQIKHLIDPGISIFGEWLYAVHSMEYFNLPGYFLVFGHRWDREIPLEFKKNFFIESPFWWSHSFTVKRAEQLGLPTVPILWTGEVNSPEELEELTNKLAQEPSIYGKEREGVVVKIKRTFSEKEFPFAIAKWVRSDHPKDPDEHWMFKPIKIQGLKDR